jgi:hypothetical protein
LSATAISISPRQTAERPADVEYDPAFAAPAKIQDRLLLVNATLGQFITGFAARSFVVALSTIANTLHADILGISWAIISYQLAWIYNQQSATYRSWGVTNEMLLVFRDGGAAPWRRSHPVRVMGCCAARSVGLT